MRSIGFLLALAALGWSSLGFWRTTRPLLQELAGDRAELRRLASDGIAEALTRGAPPSDAEVDAARLAARERSAERSALADAWFAGAQSVTDYLVPRSARPARATEEESRQRLEALLLRLVADLKEFPGVAPAGLGLETPSLSRPLPESKEALLDQAERAVAAGLLVTALRGAAPIVVERAVATRNAAGALLLRTTVVGSLDAVVGFCERCTISSDAVPPRQIERLHLERVAPQEWSSVARETKSPPARLDLAVRFEPPLGAATDPGAKEGAPR